jgi:MFS family permease
MRPTPIRYIILGLTTLVAVMLYVDRFCLGYVAPYIRENLGLTPQQMGFVLDAFFYTYAFGQVPCGWLSDRFGSRLMLTLYLAIWSSLTGLMGLAHGMTALLVFRLGCGLFEAGAYPACAGLIRRWVPYDQRGLASGVVSIGGRVGGTIVPGLTSYLMMSFVPVSAPSQFTAQDLLDIPRLVAGLAARDRGWPPEGPSLRDIVGPRLKWEMTQRSRWLVERLAGDVKVQLKDLASETPDASEDQLMNQVHITLTAEETATLVAGLNHLLEQPGLVRIEELESHRNKVHAEALRLTRSLETQPLPHSMTERVRRNRLLLEAIFPESLRKIYGEGWRSAILIYGGAGLLLAVLFWAFVRDGPRRHPLANTAEAQLIEASEPPALAGAAAIPVAELWEGILTSRSLWLSALVQFGTNFGWIFLGNLFPTYLVEAHQVPEDSRGWMVTLPFMVSLPMLIVGGWWTDWMTRRLGARWGRSLPLALTRLVAAAAFLSCLLLDAPWPITIALCVFSLTSDMGLPSVWAFCLDVGRQNVGLILGWGNMWGNLGAAVSTTSLIFIRSCFPGPTGWHMVFLTCAVVFVLIGVASFGIDATQAIAARPSASK